MLMIGLACIPALIVRYVILGRRISWSTALFAVLPCVFVAVYVAQLYGYKNTPVWITAGAAISLGILTQGKEGHKIWPFWLLIAVVVLSVFVFLFLRFGPEPTVRYWGL